MAYVVSRMDWYWNLSSLLLEENRESAARLRDELEQHIVSLYKKFLSYQMTSVCSYYQNRFAVALRDIVKFDDWADTVQSIRDAEKIVQEDINTYDRQEIRVSLNAIARHAEHRRTQLLDIRQAIQDQTATLKEMRQGEKDEKQEEENEKCLADLCTTDPRKDKKRIQRTKGGLLKDSYKWILENENFKTWRQDHESRLLWVKGNPGKGKTMLLCGIIDELGNSLVGSGLLSYFFCQGTDSQINNATAVLRGLIYLLARQQTSLISHVREMYGPDGKPLFREMNSWDTFSEIFENIIRDPSLRNTYLIIDALDECETDLPQLLKFIADNSSASPRVKWIISSRNRPDIEQQLKLDESGVALSLELSENAEQVAHAVRAYIDFKVSTVPSLQDDDEERRQVRDIMRQKANGTFLWVALVIKELENPECLDALQVVKEVPTDLYELYERILDQIWRLQKSTSEFCRLVLPAATLAHRPLHLAELSVLSGLQQKFSVEKFRRIVEFCGSLLTTQDDYVYFVHQSAKDYLSGEASSTIFPSGTTDVHRAISSRSLQGMSVLQRDIYKLRHPGFPISEMKAPDPDPLTAIKYSCVYWIDHFCDAYNSGHPELQTVGQFFREKFLYWLEALSLLRCMSEGVIAIRRIQRLLVSI